MTLKIGEIKSLELKKKQGFQMRKLNKVVTFSASVTSAFAMAQPTAFPTRPNDLLKVLNPTSSTVLSDTDDARMAWVLPPTGGTAAPTGFNAASGNNNFCSEMADLQGISREFVLEIAKNELKKAEYSPVVQEKQEEYYKMKKIAAGLFASNMDLQKVLNLEDRLSEIEDRLVVLYEKQEKCGDPESTLCVQIEAEIEALRKESKEIKDETRELRKTIRVEYRDYKRALEKAEVANDEWDEARKRIQKISESLISARKSFLDMYAYLGKLEGGFANVNYSLGWDANVNSLRGNNSDYRFEKIPIYNTVVNVGFPGGSSKDSYLASLPAVLNYAVNGVSYDPWNVNAPQKLNGLPEKMAMTLRLSTIGTCPMINPERFDIPKSNAGVPVMGMAALYEYPSAFKMNVKASYNLNRFYNLIKKFSTEGGFFSTGSMSQVRNEPEDKETFSINWQEQDPANLVSEAEKKAVETALKEELATRALKLMASPLMDGTVHPESAPPLPERGGMVLAKGLEDTCGWYSLYCVGGAWILRGADAIFGSSSSEEEFTKTYNLTVEEEWSKTTPRLRAATTVFASR